MTHRKCQLVQSFQQYRYAPPYQRRRLPSPWCRLRCSLCCAFERLATSFSVEGHGKETRDAIARCLLPCCKVDPLVFSQQALPFPSYWSAAQKQTLGQILMGTHFVCQTNVSTFTSRKGEHQPLSGGVGLCWGPVGSGESGMQLFKCVSACVPTSSAWDLLFPSLTWVEGLPG